MKLKKHIAILLTLVMVLSMALPAFAEGDEPQGHAILSSVQTVDGASGSLDFTVDDVTNVPAGTGFKIKIYPVAGSVIDWIKVDDVDMTKDIYANQNKEMCVNVEEMPDHDITVVAQFRPRDPNPCVFHVDSSVSQFCTITTTPAGPLYEGDYVTVDIRPDYDHQLSSSAITVTDVNGNRLHLHNQSVSGADQFSTNIIMPIGGAYINGLTAIDYVGYKAELVVTEGSNYGKIGLTKSVHIEAGETMGLDTSRLNPGYKAFITKVETRYGQNAVEYDAENNTFVMPAAHVKVYVKIVKLYKVIVRSDVVNGTIESCPVGGEPSANGYAEGTDIELVLRPNEGYHYVTNSLQVTRVDNGGVIDVPNRLSFLMPDSDVYVYAEFEADEPTTGYTINYVFEDQYGTVTGPTSAEADEYVRVNIIPANGYVIDSVKLDDVDKTNDLAYGYGENNHLGFTFKMPAANVTVKVTFRPRDPNPYKVIVDQSILDYCVVTITPSGDLYEGDLVHVEIRPDYDHQLKRDSFSVTDEAGNNLHLQTSSTFGESECTFNIVMPASNAYVNGLTAIDYIGHKVHVNVTEGEDHGRILASPDAHVETGATVTISGSIAAGYKMVITKCETKYEQTEVAFNSTNNTFVMPDAHVEVYVKIVPETPAEEYDAFVYTFSGYLGDIQELKYILVVKNDFVDDLALSLKVGNDGRPQVTSSTDFYTRRIACWMFDTTPESMVYPDEDYTTYYIRVKVFAKQYATQTTFTLTSGDYTLKVRSYQNEQYNVQGVVDTKLSYSMADLMNLYYSINHDGLGDKWTQLAQSMTDFAAKLNAVIVH